MQQHKIEIETQDTLFFTFSIHYKPVPDIWYRSSMYISFFSTFAPDILVLYNDNS